MDTFFAMGEHGAYVWPAYGLSAAVLVGITVLRLRRMQAAQKRAAEAAADENHQK